MLVSVPQAQKSRVAPRRALSVICLRTSTVFTILLSTATLSAHAQLTCSTVESPVAKSEAAISIDLKKSKVVFDGKGVDHLADAETVRPGDVIEYRATYKSRSSKPVARLIANFPISDGMEYLPKSARPGSRLPTFAAKDGRYAATPLMRQAAAQKENPVAYTEYRAVRWQFGQLPVGGVTEVSAR